jgi:hypothetical protein
MSIHFKHGGTLAHAFGSVFSCISIQCVKYVNEIYRDICTHRLHRACVGNVVGYACACFFLSLDTRLLTCTSVGYLGALSSSPSGLGIEKACTIVWRVHCDIPLQHACCSIPCTNVYTYYVGPCRNGAVPESGSQAMKLRENA